MIRLPPRSTQSRSSAASDVYKRSLWRAPGRRRHLAWCSSGPPSLTHGRCCDTSAPTPRARGSSSWARSRTVRGRAPFLSRGYSDRRSAKHVGKGVGAMGTRYLAFGAAVMLLALAACASPRGGAPSTSCLLYTSDAADDLLCVDLGGRR